VEGPNLEVEKSKKYGHFVDGRKSSEAGAGVGTNFLILGFRVRISEGAPDFPRRVVFVALTFLEMSSGAHRVFGRTLAYRPQNKKPFVTLQT